MTRTRTCLLVTMGLLIGASPAAAQEPSSPLTTGSGSWPQWRGPTRDGQTAGPDWPDSLQPDRLERKWHVPGLGASYAGPIVTGNRVFSVGTADKTYEVVRAFDRATGDEVWKTRWEGAMEVPFFARKNGSWIRSTPAVDGNRLYVGGMRDVLVCLDTESGDVVWQVDFTSRFGSALPSFGFVCSPLVDGDHVYVQAGGGFVKLDKMTGETVWHVLGDSDGIDSAFSSPVMATLSDRPQLVVQTRNELCGVAPGEGDVLWRRPIKAFRGMNILTPMIVGNAVFTATYGGRTQLLRVGVEEGTMAATPAWDVNLQGYMTSPIVIGGHAYFYTRSNRFACVRLEDGERTFVSAPIGDDYWSIVAQDDMMLSLSDTGRLRLIRANPEKYDVVDEAKVSDGLTWAHLAVVGRDIVIREQEGLALFRWE